MSRKKRIILLSLAFSILFVSEVNCSSAEADGKSAISIFGFLNRLSTEMNELGEKGGDEDRYEGAKGGDEDRYEGAIDACWERMHRAIEGDDVDPAEFGDRRRTPLILASMGAFPRIVAGLLAYETVVGGIDFKDEGGTSALDYAEQQPALTSVAVMHHIKARDYYRGIGGRGNPYQRCREILLRHGATPNPVPLKDRRMASLRFTLRGMSLEDEARRLSGDIDPEQAKLADALRTKASRK